MWYKMSSIFGGFAMTFSHFASTFVLPKGHFSHLSPKIAYLMVFPYRFGFNFRIADR